MKLKHIYASLFMGLSALTFIACGGSNDDDYIPPAIEPETPETPTEEIYNEFTFTVHKDGEPYDSYEGLVMAGYQGWFGAPGDGCSHAQHSNTQWYHYRENDMFEPGVLRNSIDFWPDMREYEKQYTPGKFVYPNGEKATVYSAYDESSVLLHFKWMKDYGIDGVFMQRFVGEVVDNPDGKDHFDKVLEHAMKGSNTYQRAICVMYDLGGFKSSNTRGVSQVMEDAKAIKDKYQLTNRDAKQKYYLYQNGKPLIVLWGVGFNDNRPYSIADVEELVTNLQNEGFSIMLGVPTHWRKGGGDCNEPTALCKLIEKVDVIMPWFVGRYDISNYSNFHSQIEADIAWCKKKNVGYAPLCFPGSSDRNMHPNNGVNKREGGKFFWNQIYHCIKSGAQMLYIAMFDEIDEGTAIYKCLNQSNVPGNLAEDDYYVVYQNGNYRISKTKVEVTGSSDWCLLDKDLNITFIGIEDGLPTDHYLWLTGQAKKMLCGEVPLKDTWPNR